MGTLELGPEGWKVLPGGTVEGGEGHSRQKEQYFCESACSKRWDNHQWGALLAPNRRGVDKVVGMSLFMALLASLRILHFVL